VSIEILGPFRSIELIRTKLLSNGKCSATEIFSRKKFENFQLSTMIFSSVENFSWVEMGFIDQSLELTLMTAPAMYERI
jgi:hypothetical protein